MNAVACTIQGGDYAHGGAASQRLKEQLKKIGAEPAVIRRAMIAAYEAEMNVVIHAQRGEFRARIENGQLDVQVIDQGPGLPDVEQALQPGYSTASARARELGFGAGMGLPNIRKATDDLQIESTPGEGTSLRFSIRLRPSALYGEGRHSVQVFPERCRSCFRCLRSCPTQALRVHQGKPQVLDYLCVDCGACQRVCPTGALALAEPHAQLTPAPDVTLVVPPAALAQFGPGVPPQRVLDELEAMGFAGVLVTAAWEEALRAAVREWAAGGNAPLPVISPVCPAVVNLIETRFPALIPHLAPFLSPLEAIRETTAAKRLVFVVACPCQRSALLAGTLQPDRDIIPLENLRSAVAPRLAEQPAGAVRAFTTPQEVDTPPLPLVVSGIHEVAALFELIENAQAPDISVVEPYACHPPGFGSPLLSADPHLAAYRWRAATPAGDARATAVRRPGDYRPRPGLRLDEDMARAVRKLGRIDRLARSLPGDNCGLCGAPTCAALAEDIVLGRTTQEACVRQPSRPKEAP